MTLSHVLSHMPASSTAEYKFEIPPLPVYGKGTGAKLPLSVHGKETGVGFPLSVYGKGTGVEFPLLVHGEGTGVGS